MKRALSATVAVVATAALITPLVATAKKDNTNPDLTIEIDPTIQTWPRQVAVTGRLQGPVELFADHVLGALQPAEPKRRRA